MNNNQLTEVAKILGVSENSISAMDDEIKNSMTAVFDTILIRAIPHKDCAENALPDFSSGFTKIPKAI